MSYAEFPEVLLGAELYVSAIEHGVPHLLKHGGEFAPKEDLAALGSAFRNSAKQLIDMNAVNMTRDRKWQVDREAISEISEQDAKAFAPYYETVVRAHGPVMSLLENSGKQDYIDEFNSVHSLVDLEIPPETNTILTDESKENIIGAAITLLDAVDKDPANAVFVKGLAMDDLPTLRSSIKAANYLMPEDAPEDRTAPIGAQSLRGTVEHQDAIVEQAIAIASNIDLPDSIQQGDRPAMAAAMLKASIQNSTTHEVTVDQGYDPVAPNPFNSDLMEQDGGTILNLLQKGHVLSAEAQIDPQEPENVLVSKDSILSLIPALQEYRDNNIHEVLQRSDFRAPGLSADSGKAIARSANSLVSIVNYRPEKDYENVSSDEGAKSTESGFDVESDEDENDEDANYSSGSSSVGSSRPISDRNQANKDVLFQMEEDEKWALREKRAKLLAEQVDAFLPEEKEKVSIPMEVFNAWESASINLTYKGVDQTLSRIANRDISDMTQGVDRGAHATYQEAMKGGSSRPSVNLISDDFAQSIRRHQEIGSNNRVIKIEPGKGILEGTNYRSPDPSVAHKTVASFVREGKMKNGEPDVKFRAALREMSQRTVVAASEAEAVAWKIAAQKEVALDDEEKALRKEVMEEKKGKNFIDFASDDVKKFTDIVSASGSKELSRVSITKSGSVRITHPDGPAITGKMNEVPQEIASSKDGSRTFGGMIDHNRMRAANDASIGGKGITMVLVGETPKGFISKINNVQTKERADRPIDRHPDMALS